MPSFNLGRRSARPTIGAHFPLVAPRRGSLTSLPFVRSMQKPRLNFWQIWNMSFGFLGIQFGWGLQMANMSPIYKYLGARDDQIPLLWLAAPLTGFHRPTHHRRDERPHLGTARPAASLFSGRRDPEFARAGRSCRTAAPSVDGGGSAVDSRRLHQRLDGTVPRVCGGQTCRRTARRPASPCKVSSSASGAVVAGLLPWVLRTWFRRHAAKRAPANAIPPNVRIAFYIGAAAFLGAVLWTIFTTKEYPPEDLEEFRRKKSERGGLAHLMARNPRCPPRKCPAR